MSATMSPIHDGMSSARKLQSAKQSASKSSGRETSSSNSNKGLVLFVCLGIAGCCLCYGAYKFLQGREVNTSVNQEGQILNASLINETLQSVANFTADTVKNITESTVQVVKNTIQTVNDTVKEPTKVIENLAAKVVNITKNVEKAPEPSGETTEKCGFIIKRLIECGCNAKASCAAIIRCVEKCNK